MNNMSSQPLLVNVDWGEIDTVLLDMDGTLLDLHFDNHFWLNYLPSVYAKQNDISPEQSVERLLPVFKHHEGTLNWYCVDFWSDELGLDLMSYKRHISDRIAYRAGAKAFLAQCQADVLDLRLITNAHRKVLDLKIEHTQLDTYFESMICSHELDAPKEQDAFWDNLQKQKSFNPERTLFIDDSEAVLDSAHKNGIQHLRSIAQPDSKAKRKELSKYPMLEHFDQLKLA